MAKQKCDLDLMPDGATVCYPALEAMGNSIPKVIYQTYFSKVLPPELEENVARLKSLNPNWRYELYDDEDIKKFLSEFYVPDVLGYFERINPKYGAARADLFRYLLLYRLGGVYLDIKSLASKSLDQVILADDRFLISRWNNQAGQTYERFGQHAELGNMPEGEIQQWFIVAAPGHPFLRAVIDNIFNAIERYNPELHSVGKIGVLKLTGPIMYTLSIVPLLPRYPHRVVDSEHELGFVYSIFQNNVHKTVFKVHYTALKESVVHVSGAKIFTVKILRAIKALRNLFLKRAV